MLEKCKNCRDFIYCNQFIGECELQSEKGVEILEDERQSEAFYETYQELEGEEDET